MGKVLANLTKNLIIYRVHEDYDNPDKDYLIYIYDQYLNKVTEYIDKRKIVEMGIALLNTKELYTNNIRKVASLVKPIIKKPQTVKNPKEDIHSISYNTFGLFLLTKICIDIIASHAYARGLIKLVIDINNDELEENFKIAYELSKYFLENFGYEKSLENTISEDLKNFQKFREYYKKFYKHYIQIKRGADDLTMNMVDTIFDGFNSEFLPEKKNI